MDGVGTLAEATSSRLNMADLGMDYGHGLTEREVSYLIEQEWARSADDVLWRRTKLGLHFSSEQRQQRAVRFGDVQGEKPARLAS